MSLFFCPSCEAVKDFKTIDSRYRESTNEVYRRKMCKVCNLRISTNEAAVPESVKSTEYNLVDWMRMCSKETSISVKGRIDRDSNILKLKNNEGLTAVEIGKIYKISRDRVYQIIKDDKVSHKLEKGE